MSEVLAPLLSDAFVDRLVDDMQRLGNRPYSEIGVPMFLVAEDLTGSADERRAAEPMRGAELAALFALAVEALRRRKPELDAGDIARLVETIADRHFLAFATPAFSSLGETRSEEG